MRTATATLALPAALLFSAPADAAGQSPGRPGPDGFWTWALAEVRRADAASVAAGGDAAASPRWERVRMGSLGFRTDVVRRRPDGRVGPSGLRALLGERALERLLSEAGREVSSLPYLNGRWQVAAGPREARVLQIRVVERPLAEVNDLDGDGRADAVLVYRPGR